MVRRNPHLYPNGIWKRIKADPLRIKTDPEVNDKLCKLRAAGLWKKCPDHTARWKIEKIGASFDQWLADKIRVRAYNAAGIDATRRKRRERFPQKYVNGVYNPYWRGLTSPERTATRIEILRWVGVLWADEKMHGVYVGRFTDAKFADHIARRMAKRDREGETPEQRKQRQNAAARQRWRSNPEIAKARKEYEKRNKEKKSEWSRNYRNKNLEKCRAQQVERERRRRQNDPYVRMVHYQRNRMYFFATKRGAAKPKRDEIFGCDHLFFRDYIAQLFKPGMSWENYGKWHLDHIRPCDSFDLTAPAQVKECWHFSNLQPLWGWENMAKSNKWEKAA